ncbi:calcineurin-binding protein 1 isoform X1 [Dendrobium catenatum]|uniref:calcineurin-binding protein 1 isoform X1 n=1 Tax=Dendrobium catenatum TaxID=906689 RepID=UPI0009F70C11|nr:calcineurin-binding protein 1 isoform X1 [Dendrobium catenatum]
MFSIAAINDCDSSGQREPLAPTKEAQEFHLSQSYHEGLLKLQDRDYAKARELFEAVLKDPLISSSHIGKNAGDSHLLQLRFLSLKNLALVFFQQGSDHYNSALHCYLQAVEIDSKDSVVWNQIGTLACTMGLFSTSRWAFEQGLICSPNNWNCMEKLLEILIAIGDEVSSLSVAELILRHWPSHSRALHVKKIIEDAEPLPFAPRGIDRLEPKHIRLKFPEKRKVTDDIIDENNSSKKPKQSVELQLSEATWAITADAILGLLFPAASRLSEQVFSLQETSLNGKVGCRRGDTHNVDECGLRALTNSSINIRISSTSKTVVDLAGPEICPAGENMAVTSCSFDETRMMKDKEICVDKEHHHERRSMRLERLRSRKSGKEELEFSSGKDPSKFVLRTLEPFILNKSGARNVDYSGNSNFSDADNFTYSSVQECNAVTQFISKASKNCGAYHIGHMFLEEISKVTVPIQVCFAKILEIEKLTRHWGQDRSPLCFLFLAELCFDQCSISTDESKQVEFFSDSSYHLCKVIELVAMDSPNAFVGVHDNLNSSKGSLCVDNTNNQSNSLSCTFENDNIVISNIFPSGVLDVHRQSNENNSAFWARFFWLSGCLSLLHVSKEKALKEFIICLSILRKNSETSDSVPLLHCRVKSLTIDRVINEINLLTLDTLLHKVNVDFMEKGLYAKCIEMLSPLLLSTKDVYLDVVSASSKESDGVISLELRAIDILISACQKTEPMNSELYLNCHRRKMQLVIVAAGMLGFRKLQNDKSSYLKTSSASDLGNPDSVDKRWLEMLAEEIKDICQIATRMRTIVDQNAAHGCMDSVDTVIGNIQSLLLTVICSSVGKILNQKVSIPGNLSPTDDLECCLLVDAAIAFCKLQHLLPSVPGKAQVDLIVAVHDLLAEYGLCCAGRDINGKEGAFLKFAIKHLLALDMKLRSLHGSNGKEEMLQRDGQEGVNADCCLPKDGVENGKFPIDLNSDSTGENNGALAINEITNQTIDTEIEKVQLGIESALDQSFFCLYGLNINPDSSSEDDLALHKNTSRGDYQTKEQCADVFQYVLPYAKALSRNGLVKLRRVFRAIRKHFPQPPDELLLENSICRFLDSPELCEDRLYELSRTDGNHDAVMNLLFINGRWSEILQTSSAVGSCSSETYIEVYGNLYYLIGQAEDTSATDKYPGFVLKKEGEEFVEQNANLFKFDLLYNPLRFESWHKLATIYDEEVDLLLNDGSKHINIMEWRKNATLPQRVEIGRRRCRRCLLMSLALAKTSDQQSQIHELLALVYYDNIQNVVPFYDQRFHVPKRDSIWRASCQNSMKHFEKAFALKPDWLPLFYLGKLCEKLGYSHDQAFSFYSKAASLNPSAVDPVYRTHASRLKLLYAHGKRNLSVLQVVAAYAFNQEAKEKILNMFSWTSQDLLNFDGMKDTAPKNSKDKVNSEILLDEAWHVLYDDCLCALQICVEGELKHFHKARYMLARGFYRRGESGDLERAKDELSFCFKSSRSAFTINMWEIDGATKKGRRKYSGHGGNKRNLEVSLSESSRKFITCIRKYILFYLDLLGRTGDLSTLERAYTCLRTDKKFYLCLCDILPIAIGKYVQVLASSIRNAGAVGSIDKSTLEQLLERMFNLIIDHVSILADFSGLPEVNSPEISEANLCGYIHQYIDLLESDIRLDALEGIHEKIRKRFKNPKLSCTNFAKIYKHASLAWCRALLMKLASVTPIPDGGYSTEQSHQIGAWENDLLLYVDLQPDEFFSTTLLEGFTHSKGLDLNWYQILSKIKDVCVRQASEENLEALAALMRCSYNFFRESSSAALPSGINLYTISSSQAPVDGLLTPESAKIEFLDLSIPRKLLLWAYTLFHGRYANISTVLKFCEENAKSRMRRGAAASPIIPQGNVPVAAVAAIHAVEIEDNPSVSKSPALHQEDSASISNVFLALNEVPKSSDTALPVPSIVALPTSQLNRCNSTKGPENAQQDIN